MTTNQNTIPLILSTGTNLGDRTLNLNQAKEILSADYRLLEESQIYESAAVDYLQQPDFLNQVLHFEVPQSLSPQSILKRVAEIELHLGRLREIDKGPRTIDIDILFYGEEKINEIDLQIPHPRLFERSFIVTPLKELQVFQRLEQSFSFPQEFSNSCWLLKQ